MNVAVHCDGKGLAGGVFAREMSHLETAILNSKEHQVGGVLPGSWLQVCCHWRREHSATFCGLEQMLLPFSKSSRGNWEQ